MGCLAAMHSDAPRIAWVIVYTTPVIAAIAAAVWSVIMIRAWREDLRRHRNGLCMRCGYDLRQTKDRCPECGELMLNRKFQSS